MEKKLQSIINEKKNNIRKITTPNKKLTDYKKFWNPISSENNNSPTGINNIFTNVSIMKRNDSALSIRN
jgi:hypothetical protein